MIHYDWALLISNSMNCHREGFNPYLRRWMNILLLFRDLLADEIHHLVCDCVPNSDAEAIMEKTI